MWGVHYFYSHASKETVVKIRHLLKASTEEQISFWRHAANIPSSVPLGTDEEGARATACAVEDFRLRTASDIDQHGSGALLEIVVDLLEAAFIRRSPHHLGATPRGSPFRRSQPPGTPF
eukprot:Trichotokara_eunicae@DN3590_c0_g1_i5.p1